MSLTLAAGQAATQSETRPLTLRRAERAIDRAFVAELAGDFDGGRRALSALLAADGRPEESAARARLTAWLGSMRAREVAFARSGPTVRGYVQAFSTLREFGPERAQLFWTRAVRDLPEVRAAMRRPRRVHVRFERLRSVAAGPVLAGIRRRLTPAGFVGVVEGAESAEYELRVNLDAHRVERRRGRTRVTAEGSFLLRRRDTSQEFVASYARRRSATRVTEDAARAFAMRRTVDDLAWAAVYRLRANVLAELAARSSSR